MPRGPAETLVEQDDSDQHGDDRVRHRDGGHRGRQSTRAEGHLLDDEPDEPSLADDEGRSCSGSAAWAARRPHTWPAGAPTSSGVEQFTPAHDRGSSHGDSRIIRQAYFEDPAYVPLLLHVYELWADLERDDPGIFRLTGGLMVGRPDAEVVAGSLASAREHGLPHELLDAAEIRRAVPELRARPTTRSASTRTRSGFVRPERTVLEHVRRAARRRRRPEVRGACAGLGGRRRPASG